MTHKDMKLFMQDLVIILLKAFQVAHLAWYFSYRPDWLQENRTTSLCLLTARIEGVCHHDQGNQ